MADGYGIRRIVRIVCVFYVVSVSVRGDAEGDAPRPAEQEGSAEALQALSNMVDVLNHTVRHLREVKKASDGDASRRDDAACQQCGSSPFMEPVVGDGDGKRCYRCLGFAEDNEVLRCSGTWWWKTECYERFRQEPCDNGTFMCYRDPKPPERCRSDNLYLNRMFFVTSLKRRRERKDCVRKFVRHSGVVPSGSVEIFADKNVVVHQCEVRSYDTMHAKNLILDFYDGSSHEPFTTLTVPTFWDDTEDKLEIVAGLYVGRLGSGSVNFVSEHPVRYSRCDDQTYVHSDDRPLNVLKATVRIPGDWRPWHQLKCTFQLYVGDEPTIDMEVVTDGRPPMDTWTIQQLIRVWGLDFISSSSSALVACVILAATFCLLERMRHYIHRFENRHGEPDAGRVLDVNRVYKR